MSGGIVDRRGVDPTRRSSRRSFRPVRRPSSEWPSAGSGGGTPAASRIVAGTSTLAVRSAPLAPGAKPGPRITSGTLTERSQGTFLSKMPCSPCSVPLSDWKIT